MTDFGYPSVSVQRGVHMCVSTLHLSWLLWPLKTWHLRSTTEKLMFLLCLTSLKFIEPHEALLNLI